MRSHRIMMLLLAAATAAAEPYLAIPTPTGQLRPDSPEWRQAPVAVEFLDERGQWSQASPRQTSFQLLHDGGNLAFRVETRNNPSPTKTTPGLPRDSKAIFGGDDIELFLEVGGRLHQLVFTPGGTVYDARDDDPAWNAAKLQVQPFASGKDWGLQAVVPKAELGIAPDTRSIRVNVGRTWLDEQGGAHVSSWAPLKNNGYHSPECFPELRLLASPAPGLAGAQVHARAEEFLANGNLDAHAGNLPDDWRIPPDVKAEYGEKARLSTDFFIQLRREAAGPLMSQRLDRQVAGVGKLSVAGTFKGTGTAGLELVFLDAAGAELRAGPSWALAPDKWERRQATVARPEKALILKSVELVGKGAVSADDLSAAVEPEAGSLQLGKLQPLPPLVGRMEPLEPPGFAFGAPAAKPLRVLAFIADTQAIGDRILMDFGRQAGIEIDIVKDNAAYDPDVVKRRFERKQYDAFLFVSSSPAKWLKDAKHPVTMAIRAGTGALFVGGLHPEAMGEDVKANDPLLEGVPLAEMSPPGPDFSQFGIQAIRKGGLGRGRYVEIMTKFDQFYRHGLWPAVDGNRNTDNGAKVDELLGFDWWNYYNSLYAKCLRWVADKAPANRIAWRPHAATLRPGDTVAAEGGRAHGYLYRDGQFVQELTPNGDLGWTLPDELVGGRYFLNAKLLDPEGRVLDWGATAFRVAPRDCPALSGLSVPDRRWKPGDKIPLAVAFAGAPPEGVTLESVLTDAFGRELLRQESPAGTELELRPEAAMILGAYARLEVTAKRGGKALDRRGLDVYFDLDRGDILKDYVLAADLWIPLHYRPAAEKVFRRIGVNTINCWMPGSRQAAMAGFNWTDGWGGLIRDEAAIFPPLQEKGIHGKLSLNTPAEKHLRNGCLSDPKWPAAMRGMAARYTELCRRNPPLGYMLCDEMCLAAPYSGYHDPMSEPCHGAFCVERYHAWLKAKYGSIKALNERWATDYPDFATIMPPVTSQARGSDNYAPWVEFRVFMDDVFAGAGGTFSAAINQAEPTIRSGQPNWCWLTPFSGLDPVKICASRSGSQDYGPAETIRCFKRPDATVWPWIGYAGTYKDGAVSFGRTVWKALLHGATGNVMYMTFQKNEKELEGFVHPLIGDTARSQLMREVYTPITEGLGRLVINTPRRRATFATLHSQPSMYVSWLESKDKIPFSWAIRNLKDVDAYNNWFRSQEAWEKLIHSLFWQFDYLDETRLPARLGDYQALVLPMAFALSDKAKAAIERWQRDGGVVVADLNAGLFDDTGAPAGSAWMSKVFGVAPQGKPGYAHAPLSLGCELPRGTALTLEPGSVAKAKYQDGVPALVVCRRGKGWGLYLNGVGANAPKLRDALAAILAGEMKLPRDFVVVDPADGREQDGLELVALERPGDPNLYLAALGETSQELELRLPQAYFVHDMINRQALGKLAAIRFNLAKGPQFWALRREEANSLALTAPERAKRGEALKAEATLRMDKPGWRVFHLELKGPDGNCLDAYRRNLDAADGLVEFTLPMALNAAPGKYEVEIKDAATSLAATAVFSVE